MDFLPKDLGVLARDQAQAQQLLRQRVMALGLRRRDATPGTGSRRPHAPAVPAPRAGARPGQRYRMLLIGASTGGPVAVQQILADLPGDFPLPVVVIQHMPAAFTRTFAERVDKLAQVRVVEAGDGDTLCAGTVYVAPGGRQLEIVRRGEQAQLRVTDAARDSSYRPSVDAAFLAAAEAFPGAVLALVLTGMGRDGCEGARRLKRHGATVWAQDEATSVIYGMPRAVVNAGVADQVLALSDIAASLCAEVR